MRIVTNGKSAVSLMVIQWEDGGRKKYDVIKEGDKLTSSDHEATIDILHLNEQLTVEFHDPAGELYSITIMNRGGERAILKREKVEMAQAK